MFIKANQDGPNLLTSDNMHMIVLRCTKIDQGLICTLCCSDGGPSVTRLFAAQDFAIHDEQQS